MKTKCIKLSLALMALIITVCMTTIVQADLPAGYSDPEHGESHTHIGINFNPGETDNKLFIAGPQTYSVEEGGGTNTNFPNWPTSELDPQFLPNGKPVLNASGQQLYLCDWPDGWFGEHPADGSWQLGGTDESVVPGWDISIERLSASPGFFEIRESDGQVILNTDGSTEDLGKVWEEWLENGSGGWGGWTVHDHMWMAVWANGPGETFSATFAAIDTGTTHYGESDPFTFNLVTTPEPMSLALLAFGMALIRLRSKRIRL